MKSFQFPPTFHSLHDFSCIESIQCLQQHHSLFSLFSDPMGGSMLGIHPQPRPEAETQFVTILPQDQSIDEEESIIYDFDTSFTMLIQVKSSVNGFFLLQRLDGGSPRLAEDIGQCVSSPCVI
ncbi:hypothetical protein RJ55_05200 [Drechmeria coniospora]|nr:hypothetical protein RJ55_05200 [Drechmeria coniospora]